ncbi:class I SAM-dependent methyltransferase [Alphaproteobacteria bacterium]|nr:class I SAM-dependent methyltransferase [Alphaproteobacteria bacterium]
MGEIKSFVTSLHQSTQRNYLERMIDDKIHCMEVALQYEEDYWDGDRRYGYGGYKYIPGRWKPVAKALIAEYGLKNNSSLLDVGCGKGYLLHELKLLLPDIKVRGLDISKHGIGEATELVRSFLDFHDCRKPLPFADKSFDLVISLGTLHNFTLSELSIAIPEIERVGKAGYIMVESFRNTTELFNLQCWALTAKAFHNDKEWVWLYEQYGYTGDYEFIYFE